LATTSIVLAGGKSTRLGKDKTVELIGGTSLLQRVLSRLATFSTEIILVTAKGQAKPQHFLPPETKVIEDVFPDAGSLGGIYSGLTASSSSHNLIVACDMPFLDVPLLQYLLALSPSFDAVIPRVGGYLEPLHAVYSKNCLTPIRHLLEQGNHKIIDFFTQDSTKQLVKKLKEAGLNLQEKIEPVKKSSLTGKTVVFTGELNNFSRSEAERLVRQSGGNASSSVSNNTDLVVAGGNLGSKYDKAKKLGIKIIGEKEFSEMIK